MKIQPEPLSTLKILSLPLSDFTSKLNDFNQGFIEELFNSFAQDPTIPISLGKNNPTHYLLNTALTLHNAQNLPHIHIYNTFVSHAANRGFNYIQLTKN